ncbi:MAG: hypothetical protein WBG36_09345 [Ornithinimicrobium sp.]
MPHWVPLVESKGGQEGWPLYLATGYLTVEFRSATGWDSGLSSTPQANNVVLVHCGSSDPESAWWRRSVLLHAKGLRAGDSYVHPESGGERLLAPLSFNI